MKLAGIRDLGTSPAAVNRRTGDLYLSPWFFALPAPWRKFILAHEYSHFALNTKNEELADRNAFYIYAGGGEPLSQSVQALAQVLDMSNRAHRKRVQKVFDLALDFDKKTNPTGQKLKTKQLRMETVQQTIQAKTQAMIALLKVGDFDSATVLANELLDLTPPENRLQFEAELQSTFKDFHANFVANFEGGSPDDELEFDGFDDDDECLGGFDDDDMEYAAGKEAVAAKRAEMQQRNKERYDQRQYRSQSQVERKNERTFSAADKRRAAGDAKVLRAEAKKSLADQGIDTGSEIFKAIGKGVESVAGMKKNRAATEDGEGLAWQGEQQPAPAPAPEKGKWWVWLIIAVVIVGMLVGGFFLLKKRK